MAQIIRYDDLYYPPFAFLIPTNDLVRLLRIIVVAPRCIDHTVHPLKVCDGFCTRITQRVRMKGYPERAKKPIYIFKIDLVRG